MFQLQEGKSLKLSVRFRNVIVIYTLGLVLLPQDSAGQYEVLSSPLQIFTITDNDIMLPCHLDPIMDAVSMTVEWIRPDLYPIFVHVRSGGQDMLVNQNPSYEGRTSLSINKLKLGDVSLKLSKVKLSDAGTYTCFIRGINTYTVVHLVVGAVSVPVIASIDRNPGGVVLQCESKGWYPEPEVLWLDSEGKILSAEPTETLKGSDGLFTVSSRLSVVKKHNNSYTCRVQQGNIKQTRETKIQIQDDVFTNRSFSAVHVVLHVSLVVLLSLAVCLFLYFLWKQRENQGDDKMHHEAETSEGRVEEELIGSETTKDLECQELPGRERGERRTKLQKIKENFYWKKPGKTNPCSESKIELENKMTAHKSPLDRIEKNIQVCMDLISTLEEQKTELKRYREEKTSKQRKRERTRQNFRK